MYSLGYGRINGDLKPSKILTGFDGLDAGKMLPLAEEYKDSDQHLIIRGKAFWKTSLNIRDGESLEFTLRNARGCLVIEFILDIIGIKRYGI